MTTKVKQRSVNGVRLPDLETTVDAIRHDAEMGKCRFRIHNQWLGGGHNRSEVGQFCGGGDEHEHANHFELDCDEPALLAGDDHGPNPVEHLLNALAGCVTTSMVYHAALRGIEIEALETDLEGDLDLRGMTGLDPGVRKGFQDIRIRCRVKADPGNLAKLRELMSFSPVLDTITHGTTVNITVEPK